MPDKMTKSFKKWTENLKDPAKDQIIELDKKDKRVSKIHCKMRKT